MRWCDAETNVDRNHNNFSLVGVEGWIRVVSVLEILGRKSREIPTL